MLVARSESIEAAMHAAMKGTIGAHIALLHENPPGSWHWEVHLFCAADDTDAIARCEALGAIGAGCPNDGLRYFSRTAPTRIADDREGAWRSRLQEEISLTYENLRTLLLTELPVFHA